MQQLATMTDAQRKAQREAWEDKHYTKKIDCFFHEDESHQATVYQHGHRYAGVIECDKTGESDSCEHEETRVEDSAVDTFNPVTGHDQYDVLIYVCELCECTVEGDPAADAADDRADMAYDEWRDNQL